MNILRWPYQPKPQHPAAYSLIDIGRDTVKAVVVLVKPDAPDIEIVGYGLAASGGITWPGDAWKRRR